MKEIVQEFAVYFFLMALVYVLVAVLVIQVKLYAVSSW